MVDVRIDHSLLEQVLATLNRHVYVPDLRRSQRAPIEELQQIIATATVERTVTDPSVMVCPGCGVVVSSCPECGTTTADAVPQSEPDAEALASAISRSATFEVTDCDSPENNPNPRCRCNRCETNRTRIFDRQIRERAEQRQRAGLRPRVRRAVPDWVFTDPAPTPVVAVDPTPAPEPPPRPLADWERDLLAGVVPTPSRAERPQERTTCGDPACNYPEHQRPRVQASSSGAIYTTYQ